MSTIQPVSENPAINNNAHSSAAVHYLDQKVFFKALAFLAVTLKGEESDQQRATEQVKKLTALLEEFCAEMEASEPA